ncbi:MAG: 50S ribosomal protein L4 [Dehalococcoidia bacterium]
MKLAVVNSTGDPVREIEVADEVFAIEPNMAVVHQAYVSQMANRRSGNANTKRRGEIAGSTKKTRKQKGLGASRQGSLRASHHVGGGVAMGPKPHSFAKDMPRTMKRLALRSVLSGHATAGSMLVVESFSSATKTKEMAIALQSLGVERTSIVVTGEHEPSVQAATRNIQMVQAMPAQNLNVVDLVNAHKVVMTEAAVRRCEALWGGANVKPARGRREA